MMRQTPLRVLVVDDEMLVCEMIWGLLKKLGHEMVGRARDGNEAVQMTCDLKPDVVLMDIELPGCNGIEATRQIYQRCPTPVVAMTAYSDPNIVAQAGAAGIGSYLLKPPDLREVERAILITRARFDDILALRQLNTELQREIAERKRVEAELRVLNNGLEGCVRERTRALEAANDDLRRFVYAASHDLKTPVRGIAQLTYLLEQDYKETFDEEGKRMLALLITRTKRLDWLLDGILEYARISRLTNVDLPVDLHTVLDDVIQRVSPPEHIGIELPAELPEIRGNRDLLFQIFYRLFENAVQSLGTTVGVISVTWQESETHWHIAVKDTGPGIEAKYHTRIFEIFQTLSRDDSRKRPGIGLAIVKKAVELAGGDVSVDSALGKGSTFWIHWLKHPSKEIICKNS